MSNLLLIVLLIFLGQIIGSMLGLIKKPKRNILRDSLAFAASIMLGISFFELIPESLKIVSIFPVTAFFIFGVVIMGIIDKFLPDINPQLKKEESSIRKSVFLLVVGVALHNIPEGVAVGTSLVVSPAIGIAVAISIVIHDIPENIATIIPLYGVTNKRLKSLGILALTVSFELFGFIFGYYILKGGTTKILGISLALAAGFMAYISIVELIPAAKIKENVKESILSLLLGLLIVLILIFFIH